MNETPDLSDWTERSLAISTIHFPSSEDLRHYILDSGVGVKATDYGVRVFLGCVFEDDEARESYKESTPESVWTILETAHAQGFRIVEFDSDCDPCPHFTTYEW